MVRDSIRWASVDAIIQLETKKLLVNMSCNAARFDSLIAILLKSQPIWDVMLFTWHLRGSTRHWNSGNYISSNKMSHTRRPESSSSVMSAPISTTQASWFYVTLQKLQMSIHTIKNAKLHVDRRN
jgi:hypothetical protein